LQDLRLPSEINELSEETRVDIACAIEEGNCLQAEIDLASRRCRQLVFATHKQALCADKLNAKLGTVKQNISTRLQDAIIDLQAPYVNHRAPYADCQAPCVDASSRIDGEFGFSPSQLALANASIQTDETCRI
jgi:hypothetical protein